MLRHNSQSLDLDQEAAVTQNQFLEVLTGSESGFAAVSFLRNPCGFLADF